jgi:hypothetical protein
VIINLILFSNVAIGQLNPKLSFSPAFLREQSSPLKFKRDKNYNAKYDLGIGADVFLMFSKYNATKKQGFHFGPSIGQYYFWSNSVKTFEHHFEYKENNLVSPLVMNLGFGNDPRQIIRREKRLAYSVDVALGAAYIQNSIVSLHPPDIITSKKWSEMARFRLHFMFAPANIRIPVLGFGLEYIYLDKRSFGSVFY